MAVGIGLTETAVGDGRTIAVMVGLARSSERTGVGLISGEGVAVGDSGRSSLAPVQEIITKIRAATNPITRMVSRF